MSFPKKAERIKCYSARDEYWNCMDQQGENSDTIETACANFKKLFEQNCPAQWVTHFERKYRYLKFKEKVEGGYDPVEQSKSS